MGRVRNPEVDVSAGSESWHRPLGHTPHETLGEETTQTPGMRRFEAISGKRSSSERIWMGENHVEGGVSSAAHHHGASETGAVSGSAEAS